MRTGGKTFGKSNGELQKLYRYKKESEDNVYKDKEMPAPSKKGEVLRSQMVYYKIRFDIGPTKPLLKALNALRPKLTQGEIDSDRNRAVVCGKDRTVYRMVDLLGGLSEDFVADLTKKVSSSTQRST